MILLKMQYNFWKSQNQAITSILLHRQFIQASFHNIQLFLAISSMKHSLNVQFIILMAEFDYIQVNQSYCVISKYRTSLKRSIDIKTQKRCQYDAYFQKQLIMRRVDNIIESGKYLAIEHVYSSKKHTIYQTYDYETQETYLTKIIASKDDKTALYMLHHIRNNILPFLDMRRCVRESSLLSIPIDMAEVLTKHKDSTSQEKSEEDKLSQYRSKDPNKLVFMSKKYIPGKTLREMIQAKSQELDWKFCYDLVGNVADFVLRFGGIKDLFVSADNIIVDEQGSFYLNYFSTVGMELIKFDKYIPKADFEQIFPFITEEYFSLSEKDRKFNVQIRLNFIILNFLAAFIGSELIFDSKYISFETEVKKQSVMRQIAEMQKIHLSQILSKKQREELTKFDKEYNVAFSQIITIVLKRDEAYKKISWKWILEKLSRNQMQKKQNQDKFITNFMEIIDHYIQILSLLFSNQKQQDFTEQRNRFQRNMQQLDQLFVFPTKEDDSYLNNKSLQTLIKTSQHLKRQKEFYQKQDWYIQELFIPIKTGMTFTRILQFKNWAHMLSEDTIVSTENINAVLKLLEFILDIENNLSLVQPYITEPIIIKTVIGKYINDKATIKYQYCSDMISLISKKEQLKKQNDSDQDDQRQQGNELNESGQLSSQQHIQNSYSSCLQIFWQQLNLTLNRAKGLCQKYYINISSQQIKKGVRISQQPQSQLLMKLGKLISQTSPHSAISARNLE